MTAARFDMLRHVNTVRAADDGAPIRAGRDPIASARAILASGACGYRDMARARRVLASASPGFIPSGHNDADGFR